MQNHDKTLNEAGKLVNDPYGRFYNPLRPHMPWQIRRPYLLALMRLAKVFCFPLYIFFFIFVWQYMKLHGYLFYGSRKHFFKVRTHLISGVSFWEGKWRYWHWGELQDDKVSNQ